ncbi:MAG: alkaline phosphatase D family protein [Bacteriovoracia bacterium]
MAFLSACAHTPNSSPPADPLYFNHPLAILQGPTDESTTQLSIVLPKSAAVTYELLYYAAPGTSPATLEGREDLQSPISPASLVTLVPAEVKRRERDFSDWGVDTVRFQGLRPGIDYRLNVRQDGRVLDWRRLRTLDLSPRPIRFALISCLDDVWPEQDEMWRGALAQGAEAMFFLGDNVYADREIGFYKGPADERTTWRRYAETRAKLRIFHAEKLVPVYATWDDHDYGADDGDATFPYKLTSLQTFRDFFPQAPLPEAYVSGPGVSSRLHAFGHVFVLMDSRYFRSPKGQVEGETHWGPEQEKWLLDGLKGVTDPVWLIDGDQYFGAYHPYDSYERNHPHSLRHMLAELRKVRAPIVLVSGDRHHTEIMSIPAKHLGYPTYELNTSAMHAKTFADVWKKHPNPLQLVGRDNTMNYLIVETEPRRPPQSAVKFTVTAYGPGQSVLYRRELAVKR